MKLIKQAFIKSLPVMAGYMVLGIGFGILLRIAGYGLMWALLMSVLIYAGSMQYVGISLITSGASVFTTVLTTLMVNARHLFYGISMINEYKGAGLKKPYLIFGLTDETYSLVCTGDYPEGENKHTYWLLISAMNQCYWILGSLIGSLVGSIIKFNTAGIDFSMTALFVTVFVEQWLTSKEHRPALIGIGASLLCLIFFGSSNFLIPSMFAIVALLLLGRKSLEKRDTELMGSSGDINGDIDINGDRR